jgi:hypothetical protein
LKGPSTKLLIFFPNNFILLDLHALKVTNIQTLGDWDLGAENPSSPADFNHLTSNFAQRQY